MQKLLLVVGMSMMCISMNAQLKTLSPEVFNQWKTISQTQISNDGKKVVYETSGDDTDPSIFLYDTDKNGDKKFDFASGSKFSEDGKTLIYTKKTPSDSLKQLKRLKTKKDDLPKDSLIIYQTLDQSSKAFYNVGKYEFSNKLSDLVYIQTALPNYKKDSLANARDVKKQNEENGQDLVIYRPVSGNSDTLHYIKKFASASEAPYVFVWTTGLDSASQHYLLRMSSITGIKDTIAAGKWKDLNLFTDKTGSRFVGMTTSDTVNYKNGPRDLMFWTDKSKITKYPSPDKTVLPEKWQIPSYSKVTFMDDKDDFLFGIAPILKQPDTTLLEEEIVKVEVWHTEDDYLYTMQESQLEQVKKKTFAVMYKGASDQFIPIENDKMDESVFGFEGKGSHALVLEQSPFLKQITWEGGGMMNVWLMDLIKGEKKMLLDSLRERPRLSPNATHMVWFDLEQAKWFHYDILKKQMEILGNGANVAWADEDNDVPALARAYGFGGWLEDEKGVLLYDRYDVWKFEFGNIDNAKTITKGRTQKVVNRIINTRGESPYTSSSKLYFKMFSETDKTSGYAALEMGKNIHQKVLDYGPFEVSERWTTTPDNKHIVFTKESFTQFPDLLYTTDEMKTFKKISDVNPQQKDYKWGSIELISWQNGLGEKLQGLLVKPAGYVEGNKYPLLINFYERSSDGLHTHRSPLAGRSSINYSYYASKGYAIFNPDITYREGYPGESCYEDLMPGVDAVIAKGFIDTTKMGLQGHSWGGYQVAYLLGKTNRFTCAEAGAPVVNMTSAYGGIRWESGMSRIFQYEKTQSRIGATLWDRQDLYLENSPLFTLPEVKTPVLILHNDEDGAVPWYQGIEYFVGLRRLGKEAWLLNYNGEPHWPVKYQNRKDFNIRMEQFFDHFLMGKEKPEWMQKGIPAIEKGINSGY